MLAPRLLVLLVLVAASSARHLLSVEENSVSDGQCQAERKALTLCTSEEVAVDEEVRDWNVTEEENATESGSWSERSRALLERRLYTDCTFVVGPDNDTQEFRAHRAMLVDASPVLESLLKDHEGRVLRMRDVSPQAFESVLQFVYTGGVCLRSFSEACELVGVASRLQVVQLARQSRAFLASSLHPGNVWQALQCARTHTDQRLEDDAMRVIEKETQSSLDAPSFLEIPQSLLVSLLQRDTLNVSSEAVLVNATLEWGKAEATRRGLSQEPDGLKEALGPALSLLRFFTLSPTEFNDFQTNSKILTYTESLAIIFNMNAPGMMPVPTNLSSINEKRTVPDKKTYFEVFEDTNCNEKFEEDDSYLNGITTTEIPESNRLPLIGIQIPKRKVVPCSSDYIEDLAVQILNGTNAVLFSVDFKESVSGSCSLAVQDQIIDLKFNLPLFLPSTDDSPRRFRVVFRQPGRYPTSLGSGGLTTQEKYFVDGNANISYFGENEFIYSMVFRDFNEYD